MINWADTLNLNEPLPRMALICGNRINESGIWWQASRNHIDKEVYGCRQAVKYRSRLGSGGNGGIPLWAEVKSLIGIAIDSGTGTKRFFAAHSRANVRFVINRIVKLLGLNEESTKIQALIDDETDSESNGNGDGELRGQKYYGLVNPFNVDLIFKDVIGEKIEGDEIYQLFDETLELFGGFPRTVMSNLGDRTLAFEMYPSDLISSTKRMFPKTLVGKISETSPIWLGLAGKHKKDYWLQFPPPEGPKIGILTGNAPESGMTLWRDILEAFRNQYSNLADVLMPEIHIHSLPPMGLSMELVKREEQVWNEMEKAVKILLEAGCKIITLACNTTIYYEPKIMKLCEKYVGARFVSIAEACMPAIRNALKVRSGRPSVGLVGIGPVIDMIGPYSGYKRHLEAEGIEVVPCPGEELAFAVKNLGGTKRELLTKFRQLINKELPNEQIIVLALTEVSMVYRQHLAESSKKSKKYSGEPNKLFIDPLLELGKYLSFLYLCQGYRKSTVCQIPNDFLVEKKLSLSYDL